MTQLTTLEPIEPRRTTRWGYDFAEGSQEARVLLGGKAANVPEMTRICGEHGGDPDSIEFLHRSGIDHVSCSPDRVPIARVAAAHGAVRDAVVVGAGS
jgi:phosphoenolpyruvate synthase/pyruvate phosphate dikinase